MIKIENLNKYYNRGRNNEIHVINSTNLEFENKGIVCFLGPSGCGKTTLLNVIGGMDKYESGTVEYDGTYLKHNQIDKFRASEIGYIFQNYVLFNEKTVYENLELVLNMFDLTKEEKSERIEFALKAVNMPNYQKRLVRQLSGGQQQRIAIARALVKSPKLIIADEPTGNLDEKNTTQIMNIIKKLSLECLIIMVTHEKRLADFYADRVIELSDGKVVNDYYNTQKSTLVAKDDVNIYLGDMENVDFSDSEINIKYFYTHQKPKLKIDVVYHNDTIYFRAVADNSNIKFKYLNNKTDNVLIDSKRPELTLEDIKDINYEMPNLKKDKIRNSIISFKDSFKNARKFITNVRFKDKLKFLVFIMSALVICLAVGAFNKYSHVDEYSFMNAARDLVANENITTKENLKKIEEDADGIILPNSPSAITYLHFDLHADAQHLIILNSNTILPKELLKQKDLIVGRLPENGGEIVIDKWLIDVLERNDYFGTVSQLIQLGFDDYEQLLGCYLSTRTDIIIKPMDEIAPAFATDDVYDNQRFKIVGVCDTDQPVLFLNSNDLKKSFLSQYKNGSITNYYYGYYHIPRLSGDMINSPYNFNIKTKEETKIETYTDLNNNIVKVNPVGNQIIVSSSSFFPNKEITFIHNYTQYTIIGYSDELSENEYIVSQEALDNMYYDTIIACSRFAYVSSSKDSLMEKYNEYNPTDVYQQGYLQYQEEIFVFMIVILVLSIILGSTSLLFLYFTIRASLISRIYEVGVYRSIGVNRFDIIKLFFCELVILLLFSSFIGFILGNLLVKNISASPFSYFYYSFINWIESFLIIVVINFGVGLLPVIMLMRLTPYQIITKYDM